MSLTLTSSAFKDGEFIPVKYSCKGQGVSPALKWTGAPAGTASLAIIVEDPDAPRGSFIHWLLFNMPPGINSLPEGVPASGPMPNGGMQGKNDAGSQGYYGPCPPPGKAHRYYFKLYALDTMLDLKAGAGKAQAQAALSGHVLGEAQLMGLFGT